MALLGRKAASPPITMSPARRALADAIRERHDRADEDAARHEALARATAAIDTTRTAQIAAEEAVAKAADLTRDWMLAGARGEKVEKPISIREARANLEVASMEADAAREVFDIMQAEVEKHRPNEGYRTALAKGIAAAIVRDAPKTAMLISEAQELRRQLNEKLQIIFWISRQQETPAGPTPPFENVLQRLNRPGLAADAGDAGWEDVRYNGKLTPWARSLEALLSDAGAKIEIE